MHFRAAEVRSRFANKVPCVIHLWLNEQLGEQIAGTEPFMLRTAEADGTGALAMQPPTEADWLQLDT
eukprot:SAG22_NODE_210_length_15092_cov_81.740946_12_plen_67_part_00